MLDKILKMLLTIESEGVAKATIVDAMNTLAKKKYRDGPGKCVCSVDVLHEWLGLQGLFAELYQYNLKHTKSMPSGLKLSVDTGGAK